MNNAALESCSRTHFERDLASMHTALMYAALRGFA